MRSPALCCLRFQSTLPRRERLTHLNLNLTAEDFNPRSREGSDAYRSTTGARERQFQSTLPRRERHQEENGLEATILFQSTLPRRERRLAFNIKSTNDNISIHAPAKGATNKRFRFLPHLPISIHAPAKGATNDYIDACALIRISIHAPAKGATECIKLFFEEYGFQSTLPRRERLLRQVQSLSAVTFQSTLPRRERPCHPRA